MAPKKKKPGSSIQPKTPLSTPIQPSSNTSVFFPLSSSSFQKDCELMDAWLHTQSLPEKLLQCWKNIKNHSLSEFQPSSTQLSHPDLTSKIFKELENINKRLDKQEAKPSYAQAAQKATPSQIPLAPRTLREVLVHPGNQTPDMANRTHVQLFQALCQGVDVVTFIDCLIEQEGKAKERRKGEEKEKKERREEVGEVGFL